MRYGCPRRFDKAPQAWPAARQVVARRNADGVVPLVRRNARVNCVTLLKPLRSATSPIEISLSASRSLASQEVTQVSGRVTDAAGAPLAAVAVRIESPNAGALSGPDGTYRIVVPAARVRAGQSVTVTASRQGLASVSRTVTLTRPAASAWPSNARPITSPIT